MFSLPLWSSLDLARSLPTSGLTQSHSEPLSLHTGLALASASPITLVDFLLECVHPLTCSIQCLSKLIDHSVTMSLSLFFAQIKASMDSSYDCSFETGCSTWRLCSRLLRPIVCRAHRGKDESLVMTASPYLQLS